MTTDSAARGHTLHTSHHAKRPHARHGLRIVAALVTAITFTVPVAAPAGAGGGLLGGLLNTLGQVLNAVPATLGGVLRFGASPLDEFANQPSAPLQPGQVTDLIGARPLRSQGIDGSGVDVALIDTGVAPVPGLDGDGAVIVGPDLSFDSQGADMPAGLDAFGHGSHMASLIAGRGTGQAQGVAPGARILDMKVGAANGAVDVSQVIAAINWVDQHRNDPGMDIRVINLSYGTDGVQPYQVDPLAHAVETAWRHGIVVVVAAGNSGGALTNPAIDPYVLTVGAADMGRNATSPLDDEVADFSSVGTAERRVDVVAPGVSLIGARVPGSAADTEHPEARVGTTQFRGSGTSQAAAVVSGAVALLLQQRPDLTPDQVKSIVVGSGRQLVRSPRSSQGAGLLHVTTAGTLRPGSATQAHPVSTGLGRLDAARGTARVSDGQSALTGEIDVMSAPWVPGTWAPATTAGTTWDGGRWNGNTWTGDGWDDGELGTWTGRTWRGQAFTGRTWRGETWTGRTWRGEAWSGRTWRSDVWTGRTWRSVS
jgi:serine protease AprX